jgi:hypothetical protein
MDDGGGLIGKREVVGYFLHMLTGRRALAARTCEDRLTRRKEVDKFSMECTKEAFRWPFIVIKSLNLRARERVGISSTKPSMEASFSIVGTRSYLQE